MICKLHRFTEFEETCPRCEEGGLRVVECEIDKIERVYLTMQEQGWELQGPGSGSRALLVFKQPAEWKEREQ